MANKKDILEILGLISVAFPNFKMVQSGDVSTADAYMAFLGDLPADILKVAVLKCCSESGRAFAPSVGEIRGAAGEIQRKAQNIPSTLEAWNEVCKMPTTMQIIQTGENPDGEIWIARKPTEWSHPAVEKVARGLGWPKRFPGDNESTDRAHFFRMYESEINTILENNIEIPEVTRYIESNRNEKIKLLVKGMEK